MRKTDVEGMNIFGETRDEVIVRLQKERAELADLLKRAREEMRLIRMKDCGAVYDVTLRIEMDIALVREYRS